MKFILAFTFIILATIMMGLYFVSNANYRALNQSARYWSFAVLLDAAGLTLLGGIFIFVKDINEPTFFGIISNTALFASLLFQTLSLTALRSDISRNRHRFTLALIVVFAIVWNYLRVRTSVNERVLIFATLAILVLVWQIYEIIQGLHNKKSRQLSIVLTSVSGEVVFTGLRIFAVSEVGAEIVNAEQLPVLGIFSLWLQYALKIIVYAALVGHWSETLATKKVLAELEAKEFKTLSQRQEKLIADLGRLNKAATAGVLAASIAHELSQPLQSILLNNSTVVEEVDKPTPDMLFLKSTLEEQVSNANRMIEIINTLRGVFTESSATEQTVDMYELTERLGLLIQPQAQKRQINVTFEQLAPAMVNVRISEIQQVLLNLIGNAFDALIAHKTANPTIRVVFDSANEWVTCAVEDNGPGVSPSKRADIFKFLDTSKTTGMGLGLWLSKYIVERNQGNIRVETSPLGGAKFIIQLPKAH